MADTPAAGLPAGAAPCVIVTRPQPQADEWVASLQALGLPARALPLLDIGNPADTGAVQAAWAALPCRNLAMFVSPSAVERFFAQRTPDQAAAGWPAGVLACSTGPGTQAALRRAGVPAEAIVSPPVEGRQFDSEALWAQLRGRRSWQGAQALIVRGEAGRDWLADTLRQHGAQVHFVEAYRRTAPVLDEAGRRCLADALARPAQHLWLFSSSQAVQQLPALAPGADWSASQALATHQRIAQAARGIGFGQVTQVEVTPAAVAAQITRSIQSARP